jgi:hypothetical protein
MQLRLGHKLLEFDRSGEWVNVGIDRSGGKDGWIHGSLVSTAFPGGGSTAPADVRFDRFDSAFRELNERVLTQTGVRLFTNVKNLGDGIIEVTATDVWAQAPRPEQESTLGTLFNLWEAADDTNLPIMVRVVDRWGNLIISKTG